MRAVPHTALQERRTPAASGVSPVVAGAVLGQALAGHTRPCGPPPNRTPLRFVRIEEINFL
ncbi:hypothetical protein CH260_20395 [Rhodococcus sp. 05-2256-B2]|uniref:hypothetical protein n=1 Tax=Nocardiaceae TaxID=85025 RepID=UPI00050CBA79|nr:MULTISPECIES: hypothetical protein [Rhodococcus]OZD85308.1 hypothetical protein CH258_13925 [Rhodococcus sp. 05-2256-B4]OZD92454.1 hypothetical protein CH260_20395 [Rhodococcus sp. 05-2256-B2]OZD99320.1 hypothetical protein CH257_00705 [Rhodococcus sp. 05-2256-B3]OZE02844.1 hypothetical protein CH285_12820 [Rhodococcus sp. 05-2256-B1]